MEYLGHIVGGDSVHIDPKNIQDMKDWRQSTTLKRLIGYWGFIGYYRKMFFNYGKIARPLTILLKRNYFSWDDSMEKSIISLNNSMCLNPILVVPNFTEPFVLECDTLGIGLGVVLTKQGMLLSFTSKKLCDDNLGKYTYEKEMKSILHVVDTWLTYLLWIHFQIKTHHHNLKYFLEQRLSSP